MFGISYWTAADGVRLADDLERSFADEANRQYFWDEVPLTLCCEHYQVKVRACSFDDVSEIDSFAELQEIDPAYCILLFYHNQQQFLKYLSQSLDFP